MSSDNRIMVKQRKPDLAKNNYSELERRVDTLMSTERNIRERRKQLEAEEKLVPKPNLPMDDKKLHIKVLRDEDVEEPADVSMPLPDSQPELKPESQAAYLNSLNETADTTKGSLDPLAQTQTDQAVSDIIAQEGDQALKASEKAHEAPQLTRRQRLLRGFVEWWRTPLKRNLTLGLLLLIFLIVGVVPTSRYAVLNTFGVRSSLSMRIVDNSSLQPLRNVEVRIGDAVALTDERGNVSLHDMRLGDQEVSVSRRAFADRTIRVTLGWGSNPLGEYWLYPTGAQYVFAIEDFLSGEPISEAEVLGDDVSALANEEGLARLTVEAEDDAPELTVTIEADGYRTDTVTIDANMTKQYTIQLAPYLSHFFVSERNGQFDVYSIDADGENEEIALEATGSENDTISLLAHPSQNRVAVLSTRDNERNDDGFLLTNLTVVDTTDDYQETIATSERIQLIDWYDDYLVFLQISEGASGTNPERHRIVRYNYRTKRSVTLATSNYFNGVLPVGSYVYFAPSSIFQEEDTRLERIHVVDDERETVLERESWNLFRTGLDTIRVATASRWYEYNISSGSVDQLDEDPVNPQSRYYRQNPWDETVFARAEQLDGQGRIVLEHRDSSEQDVLAESAGVGYPVRWLNKTTLMYRVHTLSETADYVVSTDTGAQQKLRNVTASTAAERWYTY